MKKTSIIAILLTCCGLSSSGFAYEYSTETLSQEYTPEQWEQIKASMQAEPAPSVQNFVSRDADNSTLTPSPIVTHDGKSLFKKNIVQSTENQRNWDNRTIYEEVTCSNMNLHYDKQEKLAFGNYRKADVLDIIHTAEPELDVKVNFTSSAVNPVNDRVLTASRVQKAKDRMENKQDKETVSVISESQKLRKELEKLELGGNNDREEYLSDNVAPIQRETINISVCIDRETDIKFNQFDIITDLFLEDKEGLFVDTYKDGEDIPHVVIIPSANNIDTILKIVTDNETYVCTLKSTSESGYMPSVNIIPSQKKTERYQEVADIAGSAELKRSRQENKPIMVQNPDEMNFDYITEGNGKKLDPKMIWDDGRFTYLLFPKNVYKYEINIMGMLNSKISHIREFLIQDDFMKIYGTWEELIFKVNDATIKITNNGFIP